MTDNRPYVLWRRVSTKQQGESGLGLDAQQTIAEYFMHSEPAKVFTDVYSGTKLDECPNLRRAMKYCKEHNMLLVIAKTDRFRNVQQALAILDEMGEGNLCFCDIPVTDRTVLTLMFAIWERQAIMGRLNTKRGLEEARKRGKRLGNAKGVDLTAAHKASAIARADRAIQWRESSQAVKFALRKRAEGWTLQRIVDEIGQLYDDNLPSDPSVKNPYGTPKGLKPSCGTISCWLSGANPLT